MLLTDIHCHILPGVDDGAQDGRMTIAMLEKAYKQDIRRIIVTPHYRRGMFETPERVLEHRYEQLRACASRVGKYGIEIYFGCEYHRHQGMAKALKAGKRPTLAGSKYVLTEFSSMDTYLNIRNILYELATAGYIPVVAHIERYPSITESHSNLEDALNLGIKVQINADSVLGRNGWKTKHYCSKLMKRELVDFIASDSHDLKSRPCRLKECADYVEKKWGSDLAHRIFVSNPELLLGQRLEIK